MTRRELADAVHEWLIGHGVDRPIDETYVGKLERGDVRWPNRDYRTALRIILDVPDDQALGFVRPRRADVRPVVIDAGVDVEAWQLVDVLTRSSIDERTVEHLEVAMAHCAQQYPAEGPRELGPLIHRQLGRVRTALDSPQPVAVRERLTRLLGYLAVLAANVAADSGDPVGAAAFHDVASLAANECGDDALWAWANANRAIASFSAGEHPTALALLAEATAHAGQSAPRRRAWIAALLARSEAQRGDRDAALRALDSAHHLLQRADDAVGGTDFFDEVRLSGLRGSTLLLLGDVPESEQLIRAARAARASSDVKGRALLTLDLARCRLAEREYDEASRLAVEGLTMASHTLVEPILAKAGDVAGALSAAGAPAAACPVLDQLAGAGPLGELG